MFHELLPPYVFVIDTENYAGGFERQMCGYITGAIGDCGVGEQEAAEFYGNIQDSNPFENVIGQVPDDHGCLRPVTIWPTPGWFNNGVGGHFRENDVNAEQEAQKHYEKAWLIEAKQKLYARPESNLEHRKHCYEEAAKKYSKHPAYLSVAIFFRELPPNKLINIMKERARQYCAKHKIPLTNLRLLQLSLEEKEIDSISS